jgi:hypothetical protein
MQTQGDTMILMTQEECDTLHALTVIGDWANYALIEKNGGFPTSTDFLIKNGRVEYRERAPLYGKTPIQEWKIVPPSEWPKP